MRRQRRRRPSRSVADVLYGRPHQSSYDVPYETYLATTAADIFEIAYERGVLRTQAEVGT